MWRLNQSERATTLVKILFQIRVSSLQFCDIQSFYVEVSSKLSGRDHYTRTKE